MANAELISSIFDGVFGGLRHGYEGQKKIQRDERARQDDLALAREEQGLRRRQMDRIDADRQQHVAKTEAQRAAQDAIINSLSPDSPIRKALEARRAGLEATPKDFAVEEPSPIKGRTLPSLGSYEATFGPQATSAPSTTDQPSATVISSRSLSGGASDGPSPGVAPKYTMAPADAAELVKKTKAEMAAAEKRATEKETRGLDVQAADALRRGDRAEYERLLKVKREMGRADDRPVDPNVAVLRDLAVQNAKTAAAGLPPKVQTRVDSYARGFDTQPVVRRVQTMAEAVSFANGLNPKTANPADDQALIYAFAKAMDPESVVREGEYATVQKYAQSWAESFGFDVKRIFSNTTFLTEQARANMKATITSRFKATKGQYDNLRRSTVERINKATGLADGEERLTDYGGAFPEEPGAPPPGGGRGQVPVTPRSSVGASGPVVGEERTNPATGQRARWDGRGWKPVK